MECPICRVVVPDSSKFCPECGTCLSSRRTAPGHEHQPTAARGATAAQRRQLTVMFCDLVGSTRLASRLDPEDLREVIEAYQGCVAEIVGRFDGFVAKYMGDGVLIYFGYPHAHEDDAERAVRAGLALVSEIGRLQTKAGCGLQLRVGIGTGPVVVGDLIGSGVAQERAAVGETPNLAARLQALAEPNTVVIGPRTRRLVGDLFECRDLGAIKVKGFDEPVRASQVLRPGACESRFEALHSTAGLLPLIGRKREIELLLQRWEQAKRGEGQVVLLVGAPGLGKSRIIVALQEELADEPHTRLRHFCSPYHRGSALYPVVSRLERAAGFERDDTADVKLDKLEALLRCSSTDPARDAPLLAELLSVPAAERYPPLDFSPNHRKETTLALLLEQLDGLTARHPVLMVFEDAHWIDPTTQELLGRTAEHIRRLPVLLVVTFRPEFDPPWASLPHATMRSLRRLSRGEAGEMIHLIAGDWKVPADVVEQIIERADGVPLFLEELTKAVLESGLLREQGDRYTGDGPLPPLAIPTTLQASLLARLDRLGAARGVAQTAAAIGREFSYELVAELAGLAPPHLRDALRELEAAELILARGIPPRAAYAFKHALVQETARNSLLRGERQDLHRRIGELLERRPDIVRSQPELLAQHFAEARLPHKAVPYWLQAGRLAMERSANAEAMGHFRRGIEAAAGLRGPERASLEVDLHLGLAAASVAAWGYAADATEQAYVAARDRLQGLGDDARHFAVLYGLFVVRWNRAELSDACQVATDLLDRAARAGDPAPICVGHRAIAVACNPMGRFETARDHAAKAVALYNEAEHRALAMSYGHDIGVAALMHRSIAEWFVGEAERAAATAKQVCSLAGTLQHGNTHGYTNMWITFMRLTARDMAAAQRSATKLLRLGEERRMAHWAALGRCMLGGALCAQNRPGPGLALLDAGLRGNDRSRIRMFRPTFLSLKAEGLASAGCFDEALRALGDALDTIESTSERWWEAEVHRTRALILLARGASGDRAAAERDFRTAMATAKRQGARFLHLRAATGLAALILEDGRRKDARDLLAPICGALADRSDTRDVKKAKRLLDELGG